MDSNGNLYATKKLRDEMDAKLREMVGESEEPPADSVPVEQVHLAELAAMNRRGRLVFYSERRRGASVEDAMSAARRAHFR